RVTSTDPKQAMPPGGRSLTPAQVAMLKAWIDAGAPGPVGSPRSADTHFVGTRSGRRATDTAPSLPASASGEHWAFRPIARPRVPGVKDRAWVRNPIDAFVLARLEKQAIRPSPEADPVTLIRRVSLDLTGLPPTPEEVEAFLKDCETERALG